MEALISLEIFEKVWARTQLPAQNVLLILKEYEGSQLIYKRYVIIIFLSPPFAKIARKPYMYCYK